MNRFPSRPLVLLLMVCTTAGLARAASGTPLPIDWTAWQHIAVQSGGRLKPLDSYAREKVRTITGAERFGKVERVDGEQQVVAKYEPAELFVRWMLEPDAWSGQPLVLVNNLELRKKFGMAPSEKWIAPDRLGSNAEFLAWINRLQEQRKFQTKLDEKVWEIGTQLSAFESIAHIHDGKNPRELAVVPTPDPQDDNWLSLGLLLRGKRESAKTANEAQLRAEIAQFRELIKRLEAGIARAAKEGVVDEEKQRQIEQIKAQITLIEVDLLPQDDLQAVRDQFGEARAALRSHDPAQLAKFQDASRRFAGSLRRLSERAYAAAKAVQHASLKAQEGEESLAAEVEGLIPNKHLASKEYPAFAALHREVHLNALKPFRWSWALYATAAVLFSLGLMLAGPKHEATRPSDSASYLLSMGVYLAALGLSIYGFYLRTRISGRPPVTNMYETVIWVSFMASVFGLILEAKYRQRFIALAGAVMAMLGMLMADNGGVILDPAINTLEPVLRSSFWLTTHVLTIVSSYAAFALALGLSNLALGYYIFAPRRTAAIRTLANFTYRAIQIGVVLVAAGTILGGVWADYSWGRFWGWDPKEVCALVVLLFYVAVLHARYAGWVRTFGLVAVSALCFTTVVMSWYGVNFVLGVGLHSYGFGKGGLKFVVIGVLAEWMYVALAFLCHEGRGGGQELAETALDEPADAEIEEAAAV